MSKWEILTQSPAGSEKGLVVEILERTQRVVVFGSTLGGVYNSAELIKNQLKQDNLRGIKVQTNRDVERIEAAFFNCPEEGKKRTLPLGVLALPEMRQYPDGFTGMYVETPFEQIENLCIRYRTPYISITNESLEDVENAVELLTP